MYKLIAIDMDGTLLKDDKSISKATESAIIKAKKRGIKIVLTTGRPLEGIKEYLKQLHLISPSDYAITFNGASIVNTMDGKEIYSCFLKGSDFTYLYNLSKELNVYMHSYSKLGCITPFPLSKYTKLEGDINKIPVHEIDPKIIEPDENIVKVLMVEEEEKLDRAFNNLPKEVFSKYTVVKSAPYFLEFLNKETNKGNAVKMLAKQLNIEPHEVICIGDAGNDVHMIKYAGLGVAMGNAFKEVKEIADYITDTNENHGVAKVIDKFCLC